MFISKLNFINIHVFCRSLDSPIYGLADLQNNSVITVRYRDPKYADDFIFEAKRLTGAIDPPTVLAPENKSSNYRPQIGFNRNFPQASLGDSGHRMVNHYAGGNKTNQNNDNRNYASIGPPQNYRCEYRFSILFFFFFSIFTKINVKKRNSLL